MTTEEAKAWMEFTASSAHHWTVDPCHARDEDLLIFIGGECGKYARIGPADGGGFMLQVGAYEEAIPHIGEAMFKPQGSKRFDRASDAVKFLIERGGVSLLLDFLGIRAYPKAVR